MAQNATRHVTATGLISSRQAIKLVHVTIAKLASSASLSLYADPTYVWKKQVRVATTANGTFATAFANGQTVDSVTLATNDRILLKNQTDQTQNGIYIVQASGAPLRAVEVSASKTIFQSLVYVTAGTTNTGLYFNNTNTVAPVIGTDNITFAQYTLLPAFYVVDGNGGNNLNLDINIQGGLFGVVAGSAEYNVIFN